MTAQCYSFPAIVDPEARILILGSMPGEASLRAQQYYAHPQNAFWKIMDKIFGAGPGKDYALRVAILQAAGIAVWDVLQSCERTGSLDSAIKEETPNDFAAFFKNYPGITHVFFNGAKAEASFHRLVLPNLGQTGIRYLRLPSTSPAHAMQNFETKLTAWRAITQTDL